MGYLRAYAAAFAAQHRGGKIPADDRLADGHERCDPAALRGAGCVYLSGGPGPDRGHYGGCGAHVSGNVLHCNAAVL